MTFNVHTFENPATTIPSLNKLVKEHKLDDEIYTQEKIANLIKVLNVDFLALQEYTTPYNEIEGKVDSKQFFNLLDNQYYQINSWLGKSNQEIKLKIGNAIFIKKNNKILYIDLNNIHLFHISKDDKVYRDFLGYKFKYNNEEFYFFNLHPPPKWYLNKIGLKHSTFDEIELCLDKIRELVNPKKNNVIICGDFNTEDVKNYDKDNLINCNKIILNEKDDINFTSWGLTKIDNIIVSQKFHSNYKIINNKILNIALSDHFPVFVDFIKK